MNSLYGAVPLITMPRLKDNNMAYREITQPILEGSNEMVQNVEFDLDASIEHIAHWLPTQGPIKDFIHHIPYMPSNIILFMKAWLSQQKFSGRAVICRWKIIKKCTGKAGLRTTRLIGLSNIPDAQDKSTKSFGKPCSNRMIPAIILRFLSLITAFVMPG